MPIQARTHEAYDVLGGTGPIVLCCEHASNALHQSWGEDAWLQDQHWAWDPGAADVTRGLADRWGSPAVLARFSRLLIDANRPLYSGTLFRTEAVGRPIHLNQDLTDDARLQRIRRWYTPYHRALDEVCGLASGSLLLSIHSFTPRYQDQPPRRVEVGVLFESHEVIAARLQQALLADLGRDVRLNEPYSGKGGLMFSCYTHARDHGMYALELELRQDLLADAPVRDALIDSIARVLPDVLDSTS